MTHSEISALESKIQSVCTVRTVLRQEDPRPKGKGGVRVACFTCSKPFWIPVYRVKEKRRFCSKRCMDEARRI